MNWKNILKAAWRLLPLEMAVDAVLELLEEQVEKTENKVDDKVIEFIRQLFINAGVISA